MLLLCPHSQVPSPELREAYRWMQPRLGKSMFHDYTFWQGVKADCPNIKLIGRLYDEWQTHAMTDPVAAGRSWADRQYANSCFRDLYDYPEFLNEVFGYTNPDRWEWMDIAQEAYIDRWHELDPAKLSIVGNCGSGNLWGEDWITHLPRTTEKVRLVGFHGYGFPRIWSDAPNQFLRYRQIMGKIRAVNPSALGIVTEMGITHMVIPGNPDRGYRDFMSPEEYWTDLKWANDRLIEDAYGIAPDGYMLGGTVFQVGGSATPPPWPDGWASFECLETSVIDEMAAISPGTPAIEIKEEATVFEFAFGFKDLYGAHPDVVGEATSEQFDIPGVMSIQFTSKGMLVYRDGAGCKFIAQDLPKNA